MWTVSVNLNPEPGAHTVNGVYSASLCAAIDDSDINLRNLCLLYLKRLSRDSSGLYGSN